MLRIVAPRALAALGLATLLLGTACGGGSAPSAGGSGPALDPTVIKKADEIFATRCTPCHGVDGRGDGTASNTLNPKPRNFHDPEWQKSVSDDHIQKIIKVGGAGVGKSPAMPSNPDITSSQVLFALKEKVRSFGGK